MFFTKRNMPLRHVESVELKVISLRVGLTVRLPHA